MSTLGVIEAEPDGTCQLCGKTDETRPYGPNGEEVCFDCGMKDQAAAERGFAKFVLGQDVPANDREERVALALLRAACEHNGDPVPEKPDLTFTLILARAAIAAADEARTA